MPIKIFLDDLRDPPDSSWTLARTASEAIHLLATQEVSHISFDHDLGRRFTGYTVATFIEEACMNGRMKCPSWSIHSQNPVGRDKIEASMRKAAMFDKLRKERS